MSSLVEIKPKDLIFGESYPLRDVLRVKLHSKRRSISLKFPSPLIWVIYLNLKNKTKNHNWYLRSCISPHCTFQPICKGAWMLKTKQRMHVMFRIWRTVWEVRDDIYNTLPFEPLIKSVPFCSYCRKQLSSLFMYFLSLWTEFSALDTTALNWNKTLLWCFL